MTRRRQRAALAALVVVALAVPAASCTSTDDARPKGGSLPIRSSKTLDTTRGPNGEPATPANALELTAAEIANVRAMHATAALVWHENSDFTEAVTTGVRDQFRQLDITVVAETSADFDAAKQKSDVETVAVRKPSVMLTLPVDPVVTSSAYEAVARQGTKIVFLSSVPNGMTVGRDYVNMVTDDLFQMGKLAADALAAAVGDKGTVASFFHSANHFVTNQRDDAFLKTITTNYPSVKVIRQGIADPNHAEEAANAVLVRNPELAGAYVTFSQPPAEGVLAALRSNGSTTTRIVSLDLAEPLALDMAKGGSTFALIVDEAYELGRAMAKSAGYGLLGKQAPAFVIAPAMTITKSNLVEGYRTSLHRDPPDSVMKALGK